MRTFAMLAVATVPFLPEAAPADVAPHWERVNCDHGHRSSVAYRRIRALLRNHNPYPRTARARHYSRCLSSRAKARHAHRLAAAQWRWRHSYAHRWPIRFARLPSYDQSWAVSTSSCEAGMNPRAYNGAGPFYGAFQFMAATWAAAGGTGNPMEHSWHYQAVIAVNWMHRAGAGQWPVCGV